MKGEQVTQLSIEPDDLTNLAAGQVYGFGIPGNSAAINVTLTDDARESLNDLQAGDLLGHRNVDHEIHEVEDILTEYYSMPSDARHLHVVMENRTNWVDFGGWGSLAVYEPDKDIGLTQGKNGELAVIPGGQVRTWSDEALAAYEEAHDI